MLIQRNLCLVKEIKSQKTYSEVSSYIRSLYKPQLNQNNIIIFTLRLTLRFLEGLWGTANLKGNKFPWGVTQKSFMVQVSKIIHTIPTSGFTGSSEVVSLGAARKDNRKLFSSCSNHHTFGMEINSHAFAWWKSACKPCPIIPEFILLS